MSQRNAAVLPAECEYKLIEDGERCYLIDPENPAVISVDSEVADIFRYHRGKTAEDLERCGFSPKSVANVAALKERGMFTGVGPRPATSFQVKEIALEVTAECNLSCRYCYAEAAPIRKTIPNRPQMSRETAFRAIDYFVRKDGLDEFLISFFGGEPLTQFALIQSVVEYCRSDVKPHVRFSITTNGTLITERIAHFLKENDFRVAISLDGDLELNDLQRRKTSGASSFSATLRGIKTLQRVYGDRFCVNSVLSTGNTDVQRISRFMQGEGIRNLGVSLASLGAKVDCMAEADDSTRIAASEQQLCEDFRKGETGSLRYLPVVQHMKALATGKPRDFHCAAGRQYVAVDWKGDIFPCHRFFRREAMIIGNIWQGLDATAKQQYHQMDYRFGTGCGECWARRLCGGPCISESHEYSDDLRQPIEARCTRTRALIEQAITTFGYLYAHDRARLRSLVMAEKPGTNGSAEGSRDGAETP